MATTAPSPDSGIPDAGSSGSGDGGSAAAAASSGGTSGGDAGKEDSPSLTGAAHIQLTDAVEDMNEPRRLEMISAILGWLRWRLAGDQTLKARFVGSDCELCKADSGWVVKQKGLM